MPFYKDEIYRDVDESTGEVVERKVRIPVSPKLEPPYCKLYAESKPYLFGIPGSYIDAISIVLDETSYADSVSGMSVTINASVKNRIIKEVGVSQRHAERIIEDLVAGNILLRIGRGVYRVNPWIYGKGKWKDIARLRETSPAVYPEWRFAEIIKDRRKGQKEDGWALVY